MARPQLPYDEQYATIVREVHKRAPRPLGPPALVWHIAGWHNFNRGDDADLIFNRELERFVETLYDLVGVEPHKRVSIVRRAYQPIDRVSLADGGGVVSLEFAYGAALFKVVVSRQYEHSSLTMTLDLSKPVEVDERLYQLAGDEAAEDVERVQDSLKALKVELDSLQKHARERSGADGALKAIQSYLYEGIWENVVKRLGLSSPFFERSPMMTIFADFRGLILNVGDENNDWSDWSRMRSVRAVATFDETSNLQAVDRILPFVGASAPNWRDSEFVICNYIGRRVIYASALGAVGPYIARPSNAAPQKDGCEPLNYLLLTNGLGTQNQRQILRKPYERWQLGRLVSQIHHTGTQRLLGLRDLGIIHAAGDSAIELGKELDGLFERSNEEGSHKNLRPDLENFFVRLNELSASGRSGLFYRINASRQAFAQFQRGISDFRIEIIEGYQAYDEFMRRGLFSVFEEVDRIGLRVDRLYDRANTLLNYLDAKSELVTLRHQDAQQGDQNILLGAADVLIPIAGGYYLAQALTDLWTPALHKLTELSGLALDPFKKLILFVICAGLVALIHRLWKWHERRAVKGTRGPRVDL